MTAWPQILRLLLVEKHIIHSHDDFCLYQSQYVLQLHKQLQMEKLTRLDFSDIRKTWRHIFELNTILDIKSMIWTLTMYIMGKLSVVTLLHENKYLTFILFKVGLYLVPRYGPKTLTQILEFLFKSNTSVSSWKLELQQKRQVCHTVED